MVLDDPDAPWWATEVDYPDLGDVEYARRVGSVTSGDSSEELVVYIMQRNSDPMQMLLAGVRLWAVEAGPLCQVIHGAMLLMITDTPEESPDDDTRGKEDRQ